MCVQPTIIYFQAQQIPVGQDLLTVEASLSHSVTHTTTGRTPLDERSARRTDLCLTTCNTVKRHTSMPPQEFAPAIPASERPQIHALDRAAIGIGRQSYYFLKYATLLLEG